LTSFEQNQWKNEENIVILVFMMQRKAALVNQSIKISKNPSHFILSTLKKEHFMWSVQADQSNFTIMPNQTWAFFTQKRFFWAHFSSHLCTIQNNVSWRVNAYFLFQKLYSKILNNKDDLNITVVKKKKKIFFCRINFKYMYFH
jgi:hypothetical protein